MVCRHHRLLPLPAVLGARYKANTSIWFHGNKEYLYYWRELWRNLFGNNGFINGNQGRKSEIFKESRSPALPSPPPYPRRPSKKFTQSFQDENESLRYFFYVPYKWKRRHSSEELCAESKEMFGAIRTIIIIKTRFFNEIQNFWSSWGVMRIWYSPNRGGSNDKLRWTGNTTNTHIKHDHFSHFTELFTFRFHIIA